MSSHIQNGFNEFMRDCLPEITDPNQRETIRKVFFGGAVVTLAALTVEPHAYNDMCAEINEYNDSVQREAMNSENRN